MKNKNINMYKILKFLVHNKYPIPNNYMMMITKTMWITSAMRVKGKREGKTNEQNR